jgi:hypothetical protein
VWLEKKGPVDCCEEWSGYIRPTYIGNSSLVFPKIKISFCR